MEGEAPNVFFHVGVVAYFNRASPSAPFDFPQKRLGPWLVFVLAELISFWLKRNPSRKDTLAVERTPQKRQKPKRVDPSKSRSTLDESGPVPIRLPLSLAIVSSQVRSFSSHEYHPPESSQIHSRGTSMQVGGFGLLLYEFFKL